MTEHDPAALERKRPDTAKLSAPAKNKLCRRSQLDFEQNRWRFSVQLIDRG
jgi:hypothetical protein